MTDDDAMDPHLKLTWAKTMAYHAKLEAYAALNIIRPLCHVTPPDVFSLPPIPEQDPWTIARRCRHEFGV